MSGKNQEILLSESLAKKWVYGSKLFMNKDGSSIRLLDVDEVVHVIVEVFGDEGLDNEPTGIITIRPDDHKIIDEALRYLGSSQADQVSLPFLLGDNMIEGSNVDSTVITSSAVYLKSVAVGDWSNAEVVSNSLDINGKNSIFTQKRNMIEIDITDPRLVVIDAWESEDEEGFLDAIIDEYNAKKSSTAITDGLDFSDQLGSAASL